MIFPRRSLEPAETLPYQVLLGSEKVQRIYLDELNPEQLPLGAAIVQLTVEPEESAPERFRTVVERTSQEIKAIGLQQEIMESVERLAIYKFPQISRQELEAMLGVADIKQTRIYQEAKEEGEMSKAQAIALNMLRQGMSIEQISSLTELSVGEIQALAEGVVGLHLTAIFICTAGVFLMAIATLPLG